MLLKSDVFFIEEYDIQIESTARGSGHRMCSIKKGVFQNFTKFTGKTCARPEKETLAHVFSSAFCEIFKNTFLQNTSERLLLNTANIVFFGTNQIADILYISDNY